MGEKKVAEEYTVRIGPLLNEVLQRQMGRIKEATYNVTESSYWVAGEIIAKKVDKLV